MDRGVRAIVSHRLPNAEELEAGCGDWLECCQAYIHKDNCPKFWSTEGGVEMITILNTSIITAYGSYTYEPIDLYQAQMMVGHGAPPFQSAVGHQATADILTELLEVPVSMNRINYEQQVGERAIVFKLRGRPPEGSILNREQIEGIGYDFGLLLRTA